MKQRIIAIALGIILFGASGAVAQSGLSQSTYSRPVYEAIPAKPVTIQLLDAEEIRSGAMVRACKDCAYPPSLRLHKTFRADTLSGPNLTWTPQMADTSKKVYEIPYYIVSKSGSTRLETVRVKVISFPVRLRYHFTPDEEGRLDFAIEVNHWTENVEMDILNEHGRVVEQLKDIYQGKLDLPEGHYTARTRITSGFPILTNFRDTFTIGNPEKAIEPIETFNPTLTTGAPIGSFIPNTPGEVEFADQEQTKTDEHGTQPIARGLTVPTELRVYPNPTNGKINIASNKSIHQLAILSLSGGLLKQASPMTNEYHGDLNGLPPGYYFIRIELEDGSVETVKLVLTETSN